MSGIREEMAAGLGVAVLLIMVAAAVAVFILEGTKLSGYEFLEKERLALQYGVEAVVLRKKEAYTPVFRTHITFGVILCIISAVPIMLAAAFEATDLVVVGAVCILMFMVSIAVFFFVRSGMIYGSYEKLLQTGEYAVEKKALNQKLGFFPPIYWCLTTAIYLFWSFYTMEWHRTWIIWPVAGVLYAAVSSILEAVAGKNT